MSCGRALLPTPRLEAWYQFWPPDVCAAGLVGEYALAPCPLQGGKLQVRVLVIGGDATRTDVHASILRLIYDTRNHLFLQG